MKLPEGLIVATGVSCFSISRNPLKTSTEAVASGFQLPFYLEGWLDSAEGFSARSSKLISEVYGTASKSRGAASKIDRSILACSSALQPFSAVTALNPTTLHS